MDAKPSNGQRFTLGKQSSLAPERNRDRDSDEIDMPENIDANIRLMYLANEGDIKGIQELIASGVDVNFKDIDGRTALHVAACQGQTEVVRMLLEKGAHFDSADRWGSTPLADAIHYDNKDVLKLLEEKGARIKGATMHVDNVREVPEYEIDPCEIDFTNSVKLTKGTFRMAVWRGTQVAIKQLDDDLITEDKVTAFRDELALLQLVRHPNVIQFLGAVTQSTPMMIVTEYLPKGDLRTFLDRKGPLKPSLAVKFALDIARGLNYLHEHRPEAIIHRDLEPSNILRDDSGHLKVADFGISKMLKWRKRIRENQPATFQHSDCRYVAPEIFRNEAYDIKVDVFSFALIVQEMIEGCPPFSSKVNNEISQAITSKERPPFTAHKNYSHGLKELIEACWSENPASRPYFKEIIHRLTAIQTDIASKKRWKAKPLRCFQNLEAMWKKDRSRTSSRSSHYSTSSKF